MQNKGEFHRNSKAIRSESEKSCSAGTVSSVFLFFPALAFRNGCAADDARGRRYEVSQWPGLTFLPTARQRRPPGTSKRVTGACERERRSLAPRFSEAKVNKRIFLQLGRLSPVSPSRRGETFLDVVRRRPARSERHQEDGDTVCRRPDWKQEAQALASHCTSSLTILNRLASKSNKPKVCDICHETTARNGPVLSMHVYLNELNVKRLNASTSILLERCFWISF